MKHFGVENNFPFPFMYYDLQKLYSKVYSDGKTRRSLKMAIEELGFSEDAEYHSAINDAVYTARIFQQMDFDSVKVYESIDTYRIPKDRKLRYMPTLGHMRNIFQEVLRQGIMQLMTGLQGRAGVIYVAGL